MVMPAKAQGARKHIFRLNTLRKTSQIMVVRSERSKDERMKAIRQSKDAKIVDFIDKYEGPHMLAIDGYGVQCSWCDWKGQTSKVPNIAQ